MGAHSKATTHAIVIILTKTALTSKVMGVQVVPSPRKRSAKALYTNCVTELTKLYISVHTKIRSVTGITRTAIATPTKIPEEVGQIALRNQIFIRNLN